MAKRIQMSPDDIEKAMKDFEKWLNGLTPFDKKEYKPKIEPVNAKATLYFTETAWAKMQYLVAVYNTEAAWHGVVHRVKDGESNFVCTDILVYPQEVTGATVNTDQSEYQDWLYDLDDDIFNNLKFQGHSHVNMSTSPSATDIDHQQSIVGQLDSSMYYIFVIWNKSNQRNVTIYDMTTNTVFDNSDVDVKVIQDDKIGFLKLMDDASKMIKQKKFSSQSGYYGSTYGYGSTYVGGNTSSAAGTAKGSTAKPTLTKTGKAAVQSASAAVSPDPKPVKAAVRADGYESGYAMRDGAWGYGYDDIY